MHMWDWDEAGLKMVGVALGLRQDCVTYCIRGRLLRDHLSVVGAPGLQPISKRLRGLLQSFAYDVYGVLTYLWRVHTELLYLEKEHLLDISEFSSRIEQFLYEDLRKVDPPYL